LGWVGLGECYDVRRKEKKKKEFFFGGGNEGDKRILSAIFINLSIL
jgi:hypothetical protein